MNLVLNKKGSENVEEKRKININWFPGHMTKAKREMQEKLKMVDMVIECRDARVPMASQNPMLNELIQNKPRLILLTKIDKADPVQTQLWMEALKNDTTMILGANVLKDNMVSLITQASKECMKAMIERQKRRGINPRAIRVMIVGIPNVGKSTLINRIAKKKAAQAADKPGVTRALQWVKINHDLELLDTPGVLWPKFEDETVGLCLGISGAIRDEILPLEDVAIFGMNHLIQYYPQLLAERYHVEVVEDAIEMFKKIASERKMVKANNELDLERTIAMFIKEARNDSIGRISWEIFHAD